MITMKQLLSLLAFFGLALGLQAQTASTSEACHGDHTVHASNSGFSPNHLTIHAGSAWNSSRLVAPMRRWHLQCLHR